jgi:hypothetical protein
MAQLQYIPEKYFDVAFDCFAIKGDDASSLPKVVTLRSPQIAGNHEKETKAAIAFAEIRRAVDY